MPSDSTFSDLHAISPDSRRNAAQEMPEELRQDVRLLGDLLGRVLSQASGPDLLADVERLRALTITAYTDPDAGAFAEAERSEEHTSELQSRGHLVCRLLLEKKKDEKICADLQEIDEEDVVKVMQSSATVRE